MSRDTVIVIGLSILLSCSAGISAVSQAATVTPEQIKQYAVVYPQLYKTSSVQKINFQQGKASQKKAVQLLMQSYRNVTKVNELSAVLKPSDMSPLKSAAELKQIVNDAGLSWETFQTVGKQIAANPTLFKEMMAQVDPMAVKDSIIIPVQENATFISRCPDKTQQALAKQVIVYFKKLPIVPADEKTVTGPTIAAQDLKAASEHSLPPAAQN